MRLLEKSLCSGRRQGLRGLRNMRDKTNKTHESMEIDLQKLLRVYLRKWWLIVVCALVLGAGALYYTVCHVTPQYRASITVYVNNYGADANKEYISGSSLTAAQQLVSTYASIIKSDTLLSRVVDGGAFDYTTEEIRRMMSTEQVGETELFYVHVTHPDPQMATDVANAIASEALGGIEEFVEGSSAKVVDYAKVPESRYSPSYAKSALLGVIGGGLLAAAYLTLRYLLDVRLKTAQDLEQIFEIPVLGQIPVFVVGDAKRKAGFDNYGYGYEPNENTKQGRKERVKK